MSDRRAMTGASREIVKGGEYRAFLQRWGAHPAYSYGYIGAVTVEDITLGREGNERIEVPSDDIRGEFEVIGELQGEISDQTISFSQRADRYLSEDWWDMVQFAETGAVLQLLIGTKGAQNFGQWDSKLIFYNVSVTSVVLGEQKNPQDKADEAVTPLTGELAYWQLMLIKRLRFTDIIASTTTRKINSGAWRQVDQRTNGYKFYFLMAFESSTNPSQVIVYDPFWKTTKTINPAALGTGGTSENAEKCYVVGDDLILLCNSSNSHIYGTLEEVDNGTDVFVEVTGYTASKQPTALFAVTSAEIYVVGVGGYIYKLTAANLAPTVVDAGVLTTNNLNAIHGYRSQVVAVGASDTVVLSLDGGSNWQLGTATGGGNNLTTVFVHSEDTWFIGDDGGNLYYTRDKGATYTTIKLPDTVSSIKHIEFTNRIHGVLTAVISGSPDKSYVYRTSDSGQKWRRAKPDFDNMTVPVSYEGAFAPDENHVVGFGEKVASGAGIVAYAQPVK